MSSVTLSSEKKVSYSGLASGTLMVAGTTIGAGMLGMPLVTAKAGFIPAVAVTVIVWGFMLLTGLLLLEVCLRMPTKTNILSLSEYFFKKKGKAAVGSLFIFLYYCLLIAYFAAGALLVEYFFVNTLDIHMGLKCNLFLFAFVFALLIASGMRWIDRVNQFLTVAMLFTYGLLLCWGAKAVEMEKLAYADFSVSLFATPVLFSAFGYHNIIPSLTGYLGRERRTLRLSLILGTLIALTIFLLWQWLIIGSIPALSLAGTLKEGFPVTQALQSVTGRPGIFEIGQYFAFFALTTSLIGVSFSMVDFLSDVFKVPSSGKWRLLLTALTFVPPALCVLWDPRIFDRALGLAGGIGEAFLNGLVPIAFFYLCMKENTLKAVKQRKLKLFLCTLALFCALVIFVELRDII